VEQRLRREDLESLLRSAAMAPLSYHQVQRLIEELRDLLDERAELERLLGELGPSWSDTRRVLNQLHRVLTPRRDGFPRPTDRAGTGVGTARNDGVRR
jgi:predicted component of type VI protein secretion system